MSSYSKKTNNHKYNNKELQEWYCMAQTKLAKKITDNLQKRVMNSSQAINYAIKRLVQDTKSNRIWSALFPTTSIDKYDDIFPSFTIPQHLIDTALSQLTQKVDGWVGVDVSAMNQRPKDFKKYWKTSDNWWNRYKAEWIGDYFFWPLLQDTLFQHIIQLTANYKYTAKRAGIEDVRQSTKELLYFVCLRKLLYAEVTFARARSQPLIFDQSFVKSQGLQQFFCFLGNQHNINWIIPPNLKHNKNRLHIRHYVREWTEKVLALKQKTYDIVVMGHNDFFYEELVPATQRKEAAQICSDIPPAINMLSVSPNCKTPVIPSSDSEMKRSGVNNLYLDASGCIPSSDMLMLAIPLQQATDADAQTVVSHNSHSTISYAPKSYRPFRRRGVNYDRQHIAANTAYRPHHMAATVHPSMARQRYFGAQPRVYRPRITANYHAAQTVNSTQNMVARNVRNVQYTNIVNMDNAVNTALYMNGMNNIKNEYNVLSPNYMSSNESLFDTESSRDISNSSIFDDNALHPIFDRDDGNINFTNFTPNRFDDDDAFNLL